MYNLEELTGKTITLITGQGVEMVAKLLAVNEEETVLTLSYPTIVINNPEGGNLLLQTFPFTAKNINEVPMTINHIMSVVETAEDTATEYEKITKDFAERLNKSKGDK